MNMLFLIVVCIKKRFNKFKKYLFDAEETEYEGRPKKLEDEKFQALLHEDNTQM